MKRATPRRMRIAAAAFFMLLTVVCFLTGSQQLARLMRLQPSMLLIRAVTEAAVSAIALGLVLLAATALFGRFFCAVVCPLGILQDALGRIGGTRARRVRMGNYKVPRYALAALALVLFVGGWAVVLRCLDPFSRFGGMLIGAVGVASGASSFYAAPFLAGALLPFVCLALLVVWKKRVYCVAICPVGTLLGLFSRYGVWQIRMNASCTACGRCEDVCPTGCIESGVRVDNERCVRCMNCVAHCATGSISLTRRPRRPANGAIPVGPSDPSRRAFIVKGIAAALGAAATGHLLGGPVRAFARGSRHAENWVLPPGAVTMERFMAKCTNCQLCVRNCPSKVIRPPSSLLGPVHLVFDRGACHHDCTACNAICPSGALRPMRLEDKQWLKIGEAFCDTAQCRAVRENIACYICAKVCPKGAIRMKDAPNGLEVPEVLAFHCIGCGACRSVCPMTPKAITVTGTEQRLQGT